jgi:hypothetical protein
MLATGRISPFAVQRFGYSREIERNLAEDGGPPDHLLRPPRDLLESSGEGADADGEQPFQRLAYGRRLARQVGGSEASRAVGCRRADTPQRYAALGADEWQS